MLFFANKGTPPALGTDREMHWAILWSALIVFAAFQFVGVFSHMYQEMGESPVIAYNTRLGDDVHWGLRVIRGYLRFLHFPQLFLLFPVGIACLYMLHMGLKKLGFKHLPTVITLSSTALVIFALVCVFRLFENHVGIVGS